MLLLFFWKPYNFFDIESGWKKSGWWRCNGLHPLWFSVHSCGPSKGGKVAKLKHTNLFLMQLFLPGTRSCWKCHRKGLSLYFPLFGADYETQGYFKGKKERAGFGSSLGGLGKKERKG